MEDIFDAFMMSLTRAYKYTAQIKKKEGDSFGIKSIHIMSLLKLGKNPEGMTVSELARSCIEDKAAISRMLEELAELGYVSLTPSGRNQKRHSKIKLTKAGMDIVKDMNDYIYKLADMIRKDISKEDEKVFYRVFEQINKNLADYTEMLPARNKTAKKKSSAGRGAGD